MLIYQILANLIGSVFDKGKSIPKDESYKLLLLMDAPYLEILNDSIDTNVTTYKNELNEEPDVDKWDKEMLHLLEEGLVQDFGSLSTYMFGKDVKLYAEYILQSFWNITNKEDVLSILTWLRDYGHRAYFQYIIEYKENFHDFSETHIQGFLDKYIAKGVYPFEFFAGFHRIVFSDYEYLKDRKEEQQNHYVDFITQVFKRLVDLADRTKDTLPKCGLLGFDMARYVHVLKQAYISQYLTDKECWDELEKIRERCFSQIDSWYTFGKSFMIGRDFWCSGKEDNGYDDFNSAVQVLLTNEVSPWLRFKWRQC